MKTVDQTLEQLDNTLDLVDELINELPITNERKHQLTSRIYDLWMEIEHDLYEEPQDLKKLFYAKSVGRSSMSCSTSIHRS